MLDAILTSKSCIHPVAIDVFFRTTADPLPSIDFVEETAMKSAKLLLAIVAVLLASSAWAQTLPKDSEIKVRTDTAIPAKPLRTPNTPPVSATTSPTAPGRSSFPGDRTPSSSLCRAATTRLSIFTP